LTEHHQQFDTKMSFLLPIFHVGQVIGSAYTATFSVIAITNLSKREEQTERAAKYSNTAAHQLHKTRTTQTSGALAVSMIDTLSPETQSQQTAY
jgi:hypothetical protein